MTTNRNLPDRRLSDQLADRIRSSIRDGEFSAGQRLVERKLAEAYGVSHIPIREALSTLTEEGLVERLPRRGARVAALTPRDLEEISSLRTLLEQFVVVRAQEHMNDEREARLRAIVDGMVGDAKRGDIERLLERDQEFHALLWDYADHRILLSVSAQLRARISGFLAAANRALTTDEQLAHAHSHGELVDAVVSGDPEKASQAMADHIAAAKQRVAETLEG